MKLKKHHQNKEIKGNENPCIHNVFSWPFLAMQIFGFMPLQGIFKRQLLDIGFSWKSLRCLYAVITSFGLFFMTAAQIVRCFLYDVEMADVQRLWYFLKSWFISLFFIYLAKEWRNFLKKWNKVDIKFIRFGKPIDIKKNSMYLLTFFLVLFAGDYALIQIQRIQEEIMHGEFMLDLETWNYFQEEKRFKYIYQMFPYDFISGICLLVVQLQVLFAGTFLDLFIMITSLGLEARMKLITKRIQEVSISNSVPETTWKDIRECYNQLEVLCKYVNSKIGYAILICFIGNLGIVLIQLYNNLVAKRSFIQKCYLYYAFFFLLAKTLAVCIFGSKINDESKKPLMYLYTAEDAAFNVEVDRLIRQISRNNMALSGMDFFQLRRNMVLQIAGSIVPYELVLIQFAGKFLKEHHVLNRTSSL